MKAPSHHWILSILFDQSSSPHTSSNHPLQYSGLWEGLVTILSHIVGYEEVSTEYFKLQYSCGLSWLNLLEQNVHCPFKDRHSILRQMPFLTQPQCTTVDLKFLSYLLRHAWWSCSSPILSFPELTRETRDPKPTETITIDLCYIMLSSRVSYYSCL